MQTLPNISSSQLTEIFNTLKKIYNVDGVNPERRDYIVSQVQKYGYLPYPHIKALEELSPAETLVGLEVKFQLNNVYSNGAFTFADGEISPVKRAGFIDSSWCKTEQHNIKLINLAGLGNGNVSKAPGKFIDWLKQLLTLPAGNLEKGVLSTTAYIIPFHPREFGCAYLPTSSDVSPHLLDMQIQDELGLNVKQQVQLFLVLTQLAGHPTMYDVLPQTGRFSKTVLSAPYIARWFDIKELITKLEQETIAIGEKLKEKFDSSLVDQACSIINKSLSGVYEEIPEQLKEITEKIEKLLDEKRNKLSNEMMLKANQEKISQRAKQIINTRAGKPVDAQLTEDDITNHGEIIGELISQGLWPAPGGAWNSAGVPIFNKMSEGAGYPLFKHYNYKGEDVSEFANLDCQTPYYFVYLESGEYNEKVMDFYVNFLQKIQSDYNFDGFRVDHVDHIVDAVSEESGRPISYRAPRKVLGMVNTALKQKIPYFGTLAEYMLWENFFKEYHNDMNFDLLWGSDIVSQYQKTCDQIVKDSEFLAEYNLQLAEGEPRLSILKAYNNQDGEFRAIDQYPGQLGAEGALFKWFKFKFIPAGKYAQRPVLFIDGDESFTQEGIEAAIGAEESMPREKDYEFFRKFDAINRFALNNNLTRYGIAEITQPDEEKNGFVTWQIKYENPEIDDTRLFIVANQLPPSEKVRIHQPDGSSEVQIITGKTIYNKTAVIPEGFKVVAEYVLPENSLEFEERPIEITSKIHYDKLNPSEFKIYKLSKI